MKILFFIDSLHTGGKERRLAELLCYLKKHTDFDLSLVLTEDIISYTYLRDLKIPIHIIKRRIIKYDPSLLFRFHKIAKEFNPDIIHTWGMMTTGYAIPAKLMLKKTLIANLVADAKKDCKELSLQNLFWKIDFKFADVILGNSEVGLRAYGLQNNKKASLIYNGVRLERFSKLVNTEDVKQDLNITTPYIAIMVASTSRYKDHDLLLDVANYITLCRTDVTFLCIGDGDELERLRNRVHTEKIKNTILAGKKSDVESFIAIADIGLLFTHSEGLSNSIIEYMGMGKPVITTDVLGGSKEIIEQGKSGYIMQKNVENIANKIAELLDNPVLRKELGGRGKEIIHQKFSINRMGGEYVELYKKHLD